MFTPIFSPLTYYQQTAKTAHSENVREYFKLLQSHAKINEEENAQTVAKYDETQAKIKNLQDNVSSKKSARTLSIIGIVVAWLAVIIFSVNLDILPAFQAMIIAFGLGLGIFGIVKICKKFKAKIHSLQSEISALCDTANGYYQTALTQTQPLNSLFTDEDSLRLFQKTLPFITFDTRLHDARISKLSEQGFSPCNNQNECATDALSGELYGHSFLYLQTRNHELGTCTYHGSLTIHWTTTERNSKGETYTKHHSQTLHASIQRPKPYYSLKTALHFASEEVPNVSFSRTYAHAEDKSERQLEKTVKSGEKKLRKLAETTLKNDNPNDDFVSVTNTEFDVLFGAVNRTDEYEFREMFTPRAQESMLELLLDKNGYGDDFYFSKYGKICTVQSEHAQYKHLAPFASDYHSHDFQAIERAFIQENNEFFRSLYFDFAPLLLIPPYQKPLIKSETVDDGNPTDYTYSMLANALSFHTAPNSDTQNIYLTQLSERGQDFDLVDVQAYGYVIEKRVHYESVHGGDGYWHDVPVEWDEYIPVEKRTKIKIMKAPEDKNENGTYLRGYTAFPVE